MTEIRSYRDSDARSLGELVRDWDLPDSFDETAIRSSADSLLALPGAAILVALEEGRCVGYAQTMQCRELLMDPWIEVSQLLVAKDFRGKGIGHLLMAGVEAAARESGFTQVCLSSQLFRSRTHVFYESLGYECHKMSKFYRKEFYTDSSKSSREG